MLEMTFGDVLKATGAKSLEGRKGERIRGVSTDSRTTEKGNLFIALKGAKFDGHEFMGQAFKNGAVAALVGAKPKTTHKGKCIGLVSDTLKAYGDLASQWRRRFKIPVVTVAGSAGKTTTKKMIRDMVERRYKALVSHGNFNNLIGLPMTLCQLSSEHQVLVAEIGMNQRGELGRLTSIASPTIAALTNVGNAHIGKLGSSQGVVNAKSELIFALSPGATLVVNFDCDNSRELWGQYWGDRPVQTFGTHGDADVRAEGIETLSPIGYRFKLRINKEPPVGVELHAFGRYNIENALCAATVASMLGVDAATIAITLMSFTPETMRSETIQIEGDVRVIKDCYNASPASVMRSIESLAEMSVKGRRVAVLGDMLELGDFEKALHEEVGEVVARCKIDYLLTVGTRTELTQIAANKNGTPGWHFSSPEEARGVLLTLLKPGDAVLLKGSRLMQMEKVLDSSPEQDA